MYVLVDSSAWIQCFARRPDRRLMQHIERAQLSSVLATTEMVILEVTRGTRSQQEFATLTQDMLALYCLRAGLQQWQLAAQLGSQLARKGLTPPSTDLLIAAIAIDYRCQLLQCDKHFAQIARYAPLRLLP